MSMLNDIASRMRDQPPQPPIERWHPQLSGDIDIGIDSDGNWHHEGARIDRPSLVRLFASILRREADGHYYLVTPVEKWRIQVEDAPLLAVDMDVEGDDGQRQILFTLNANGCVPLDREHPLHMTMMAGELRPYLWLDRGLSAKLTRAVYYRLVERAQSRHGEVGVYSFGEWFPLGED